MAKIERATQADYKKDLQNSVEVLSNCLPPNLKQSNRCREMPARKERNCVQPKIKKDTEIKSKPPYNIPTKGDESSKTVPNNIDPKPKYFFCQQKDLKRGPSKKICDVEKLQTRQEETEGHSKVPSRKKIVPEVEKIKTRTEQIIGYNRVPRQKKILSEEEKINKRREDSRKKMRRYRERLQKKSGKVPREKKMLSEEEKVRKRREDTKERMKRYREKLLQKSGRVPRKRKILSEEEKVNRKREGARERMKKYREKLRLKHGIIIERIPRPKETEEERIKRKREETKERVRKYRERLQQDSIKHEAYKHKNRLRYKKSRETGNVKLISELTDGENEVQKEWRKHSKRLRGSMKLKQNCEPYSESMPGLSNQPYVIYLQRDALPET